MALLDKTFHPKDTMSKADQRRRLGESTLKDGKDPDTFSMKIASLELEYNNVLTEEDNITTLTSVAGEKYKLAILGERRGYLKARQKRSRLTR